MAKRYAAVCNRFPQLSIPRPGAAPIEFRDGLWQSDDLDAWEFIQQHEWWNVQIHPRDLPETTAAEAPPATVDDEMPSPSAEDAPFTPRARQGQRGSRG